MKDRLEQFISENRGSFDSVSEENSLRIWQNIQNERKADSRRRIVLSYLSRAAAVLLIFGASWFMHDLVNRSRESKLAEKRMNDIYEQVPELREAENYYGRLVSGKLREIQPFLAENPEIGADVHRDLSELDSICNSLKADLKDNIANEQIIEAMIQNYRLKLQILEELQAEIKTEKNRKNETNQVSI